MNSRPHGRDEVRRAIVTAAKKRFASQGPSASTRDIAADAEVNLGLLHRHFGTKDALIRAVFADTAASGYERVADAPSLEKALDQMVKGVSAGEATYARMLAGMLLAGKHPRDLQDEYPTIAHLVELGGPESRPLILITLVATFGWNVYAEFLSEALGYADADDAAADLAAVLQGLVGSQQ